jgi:hypothetical protein
MLIPALVLSLPFPADPGAKAPGAKELSDARQRSVAFLLERQESLDDAQAAPEARREWPYEGVYRVERQIPVGYRVGGTSIAAGAILAARGAKPEGAEREAVLRALDYVLEGLADERMSAGFEKGYDVRGWGHAYALEFLLALRAAKLVPEARAAEVSTWIGKLVDLLEGGEIGERGGWNYSRPAGDDSPPSTFMTAPTLQILFAAAAQGEQVDPAVVERGLRSLEQGRLESGAYQYGTRPERQTGKGFEAVEGAIGRMPVCETTLLLAGRGSVERVRESIEAFFEHWQHLEDRRKQNGTHEGPFKIAPYYFFYAHRYTAQAIELLPEKERPKLRERLYALLWKVREQDGGWNDRVFPRSAAFGTAMTLLALCEPELPRPAGWTAPKARAKEGAKEGAKGGANDGAKEGAK